MSIAVVLFVLAGALVFAGPVDLILSGNILETMELRLNGETEDVQFSVNLEDSDWQTAAEMTVLANKPFTVTVTSENSFRLVNEHHTLAGGDFEEASLLVSYGIRLGTSTKNPDGNIINNFLSVPSFGQIIAQQWASGNGDDVQIRLTSTPNAPGNWEDVLTFTLAAL